ncbi:MAG: peptidylprolyl isomerase [Prosthecobacter sp.]
MSWTNGGKGFESKSRRSQSRSFSGESGRFPESKTTCPELRTKIVSADFSAMARAYSQDSRAENGGEWDWMAKTDMMPAIANAAMSTKQAALASLSTWRRATSSVSCDAKKLRTPHSLESKRLEIERMISQEKSKAAIDSWMESVRKKHVIKRN